MYSKDLTKTLRCLLGDHMKVTIQRVLLTMTFMNIDATSSN